VRAEDPGPPTVDRSSGRLADCDTLIIAYRSHFCLLGSCRVFRVRFAFRFGDYPPTSCLIPYCSSFL
jgi:hypothetical protein